MRYPYLFLVFCLIYISHPLNASAQVALSLGDENGQSGPLALQLHQPFTVYAYLSGITQPADFVSARIGFDPSLLAVEDGVPGSIVPASAFFASTASVAFEDIDTLIDAFPENIAPPGGALFSFQVTPLQLGSGQLGFLDHLVSLEDDGGNLNDVANVGLTPLLFEIVPEPGSMVLSGCAFWGLLAFRRRWARRPCRS